MTNNQQHQDIVLSALMFYATNQRDKYSKDVDRYNFWDDVFESIHAQRHDMRYRYE